MRTLLFALTLFPLLLGAGAFEWKAENAGDRLEITVKVEKNYYFHWNTFLAAITDADGKLPPVISAPPRVRLSDPDLGLVEIVPEGRWKWVFGGTPPYKVSVTFQGCRKESGAEPAICLPPETLQLLPLKTPETRAESAAVKAFYRDWKVVRQCSGIQGKEAFLSFLAPEKNASALRSVWENAGIGMIFLLALLGGIGLNLTPCVLPMIPVNLAIIGAKESRRAGFRRGALYGLGMAMVYGILGAVVVITGGSFGELNSSAAFNFGVAILFFFLALAMFGVFNFDLARFRIPASQLKVGKELGAFLLGGIAALLAGACVAPAVAGVLLFAANLYAKGQVWALGLGFILGVGMGLPWPFAGAGLAVLPKPGKFMVWIKALFGVLILGAACVYAALGFALLPGNMSPEAELARLEESGVTARKEGKLLLVDFTASWCKNCKAMKRTTLQEPEVKKALKSYVFCEFNAEKPGDPLIAPLLKLWKVPGLPSFVIIKP